MTRSEQTRLARGARLGCRPSSRTGLAWLGYCAWVIHIELDKTAKIIES
ncbi:MAG TPA: hypothetical protein VF874_19650 [Mycobacterium sp.]|jgi:hypothetical protein